jgi:DNA-binding MarR family transcriptional regulator
VASNFASDATVQFFDDLVRCETRLYNALGEVLRAEHGVATSQFEFLRYFARHPGSRIADVAANFAAGLGAISKGVDRLEARGLVRRHPNPADGRSSLVSLTDAGARLATEAEKTFRARLAELVSSSVDPTGPESSAEVLAALRSALERDRVGVPIG